MNTSLLRRYTLWLNTGLLTVTLGACMGHAPNEKEDDKSSDGDSDNKDDDRDSKGKDSDGKDSDGDDSDGKDSDGDDSGDSKGDDSDGEDSEGDVAADTQVKGTVVDGSGDPVAGVAVNICDKTGGCAPPVPTEDDGSFVVKGIFNSWTHLKASIGPGEEFEFFAGSITEIKLKKGGVKKDIGQMTFLEIDSDDKGTSFKDVEEKKVFKAGKFSFEFDASQFDPGSYADGFTEGLENQHMAVIEIPKKVWREEEEEIEGNKVVSVWGLFPFNGYMKEDNSSSLTIDDDLGLDDGTEVVIYQVDGATAEISEVGTTKVKDGAISLDEGLTKFARLYIAEKS